MLQQRESRDLSFSGHRHALDKRCEIDCAWCYSLKPVTPAPPCVLGATQSATERDHVHCVGLLHLNDMACMCAPPVSACQACLTISAIALRLGAPWWSRLIDMEKDMTPDGNQTERSSATKEHKFDLDIHMAHSRLGAMLSLLTTAIEHNKEEMNKEDFEAQTWALLEAQMAHAEIKEAAKPEPTATADNSLACH